MVATPRPDRRWRPSRIGAVLGLLLLLLLAVACGEWSGWPMLAAPLQVRLSSALHRRVDLGTEAFRIRFVGGLRVHAARIEVAAAPWSEAPHTLLASDVELTLRYIDLWRAWRGQPLRIERLKARTLDGHIERLADGRASWQFGAAAPAAATAAPVLPTFGLLEVSDGRLVYRDQMLRVEVQARLTLADGELPRPAALSTGAAASSAASVAVGNAARLAVSAQGHYRGQPLAIDLATGGVLPWLAETAPQRPLPISLHAVIGRAGLDFEGSAVDGLHLDGLSGRFDVRGPSLAAAGDPLGLTLPSTGPFDFHGGLQRRGGVWHADIVDATIGSSRLRGTFVYDATRPVPLLSGQLGGSRLLLPDLGPAFGTTAVTVLPPLPGVAADLKGAAALPAASAAASSAVSSAASPTAPLPLPTASPDVAAAPLTLAPTRRGPGRVLPDRPFDLASLRAMDADVQVDIAEVDLNTRLLEPLRPLRGHLWLSGGVLGLTAIDARTAEGSLRGDLQLDGRADTALWTAELRWSGVQLQHWVHLERSAGQPPYISGQLEGQASLKGQGRSTAEILGSLQGRLRTDLRAGAVSHLVVEAAGLDIAQALGVAIKGDDALPVSCAVADLRAEAGVLRPRLMVADTTDSALWIDGTLSLASEAMDLRVVVVPKDFSPLTLRTPLRVRGTFGAPEVGLEKGPLAVKAAASLLLALVNPLAAVIPFVDPGDAAAANRGAAGCPALVERSKASRPLAALAKPR